jgi:hypothetical protein
LEPSVDEVEVADRDLRQRPTPLESALRDALLGLLSLHICLHLQWVEELETSVVG